MSAGGGSRAGGRIVVDASELTRRPLGRANPLWWAIMGLIVIELVVVGIFSASTLFLRAGSPAWPPAGTEAPPLLWPTVNLVILLASVASMAWAGRAVKKGDQRGLVVGIWLSVLGAALVLVFRWLHMEAIPFDASENAYASMVWTLTGFHFVHVTSALLGTGAVGVLAVQGYFDEERYIAVDVDAFYWYFVALAWIPLYLVIYWLPAILPGAS